MDAEDPASGAFAVFYFLPGGRIMRCDAGTIRAAVLGHLVAARGPVGVAAGEHPFVSAFFRWIPICEGGRSVTLVGSLGGLRI
jgi:hypothetical protein